MIKKANCLVSVMISSLALATVTAHAGYYYEATSIMKTDASKGEDKTLVTVWVEGDNTRIEYKDGDNMGLFGPGSYLVSTDAGENLILVDPEKKTWTPFNIGQMMNAASSMVKGMGGMFQMDFKDFHVEKVSEEPGEDILGYDMRRIRFNSGYTMDMNIMGHKKSQVVKMDQEMWTTSAIDAAAFSAWLRPDKLIKGMFEGLDEMMKEQYSQINGAPLKAVVETVSVDEKGRETKSKMRTEVTLLREETVEPSIFAIPGDYTETQLVPESGGEDGEDTGKVDDAMSKLKGMFKRKKD